MVQCESVSPCVGEAERRRLVGTTMGGSDWGQARPILVNRRKRGSLWLSSSQRPETSRDERVIILCNLITI